MCEINICYNKPTYVFIPTIILQDDEFEEDGHHYSMTTFALEWLSYSLDFNFYKELS